MLEIIALVIVILLIAGIPIAIYLERKDFNKGICKECGNKLRLFDTDSHGGRGYCCDKCGYHTWVSYNSVDKKYN